MQIPKYIEIKDADGQRTAFLSPKSDGLKECWPDARLNGESTLEFMLPANSEKIEELTPECQIWAGGRVYTLLKDEASDTVMEENGSLWTKFMAVERWAELGTQYVEPYLSNDPTIPIPADLAVIIVGGGTNLSGGVYPTGTAIHAMYAVLQGSGWSLGTVDILGIHDLEMEKSSRLQIIKKIQELWGGYLVWDSVNKVVHLRSGDYWQNYTGFQIRYAKNMKHITRTQSNRLVTKLYCFGKDNLDIASVNAGNKFVINTNYTSREYVSVYSNPDISDPQELKEKGIAELVLICRPRYNYQIKVVDLRTLPEYNHEDFSLGDMADIINPKLKIKEHVRIIRHKYNLFQPWKCEMELGDPLERLVEQLKTSFNTAGFINNTFNSSGYMPGGRLVDLSITYKQLGMASVTTQAIAPLAVDITKLANLAVDASKIVDGSITMPKLGDAAVSTEKLQDVAITTGKLANLAVDNSKLATLAVDAAKLADSAVTATKIANAAVGSAAIASAAIGTAHIANAAITTALIQDGAIVNAKISNLAVDTAKIADASITSVKIGSAAVGSAAIAQAAIGTAHIGTGVIITAHIGDLQVVRAKIGNAAINDAKIEDLAVTSAKIANLSVTYGKIANLSVDTLKVADYAITTAKIDNLAVTNAKIANLAVTNAKINDLQANKITAGTITAAVSLTAATITSNSDINVTTDVYVGNAIRFQGSGTKSIYLSGTASISLNPSIDSMTLSALNNVHIFGWSFSNSGSVAYGNVDFSSATVTGLNNTYVFA